MNDVFVGDFLSRSITNLAFRCSLNGIEVYTDTVNLERRDISSTEVVFIGSFQSIIIQLNLRKEQKGSTLRLQLSCPDSFSCEWIEWPVFDFHSDDDEFDNYALIVSGDHTSLTGCLRIRDLSTNTVNAKSLGIFKNSRSSGLLCAAQYPLNNRYSITPERLDTHSIRLRCRTNFLIGHGSANKYSTETSWIGTGMNPRDSLQAFASHVPPRKQPADTVIGWNSWDYYFRTIGLEDVQENIDAIRSDRVLAESIRYIIIDDGWQHEWGDWHANYKFPDGMENAARVIGQAGFIPGIWTAPIQVDGLSKLASRQQEVLLKNEYGDPLTSEVHGFFLLDPSHPLGREFLLRLYRELYTAGFRYFKVDYVQSLLRAHSFYDRSLTPYEAIRSLFTTIRSAVTDSSYILGCSLPQECGPGCADSGRIGIDIHNHWSHVEWVADSLQSNWWLGGRIWTNDPDFLIVRGTDTSLEPETNVLNPNKHNPDPPRWRRGPVFSYDEARTWATLVLISGGDLVLSDRINKLNQLGLELVKRIISSRFSVPAIPLDLGDGERPGIWFAAESGRYRLALINWTDRVKKFHLRFTDYAINPPVNVERFWEGGVLECTDGLLESKLNPHQSEIFSWI